MKTFYLIFILLIFACSCKYTGRDERTEVERLLGKELKLFSESKYWVNGVPVINDSNDADYRIVTYIDSTECTQCKMKLTAWTEIINSIKSISNLEVKFLMIVNTPDTAAILDVINKDNFCSPITFDNGSFKEINSLPKNSKYHTFLLDENNQILVIGNPSENPKIYKLYMQELKKGLEITPNHPKELCSHPVIPIGGVYRGDSVQKSFLLKNSSLSPIFIEDLVPSCGCVEVMSDTDTIYPDNSTEIKLKIGTDTVIKPFKYHVSVYFKEFDDPYILTIYGHTL